MKYSTCCLIGYRIAVANSGQVEPRQLPRPARQIAVHVGLGELLVSENMVGRLDLTGPVQAAQSNPDVSGKTARVPYIVKAQLATAVTAKRPLGNIGRPESVRLAPGEDKIPGREFDPGNECAAGCPATHAAMAMCHRHGFTGNSTVANRAAMAAAFVSVAICYCHLPHSLSPAWVPR